MGELADGMTGAAPRQGLWTPDSIDRRSLMKKAGAAGVVAWTAPLIIDSMVSPAAAGTVASEACYKFQYNWWRAGTIAPGNTTPDDGLVADKPHNLMRQYDDLVNPDATWHEECQASDDDGTHLAGWAVAKSDGNPDGSDPAKRYQSNQASVNGQCCKGATGSDEAWDWWEGDAQGAERIATFPDPQCIIIDPVCGTAGTGAGFENGATITISFSAACRSDCFFFDPFLAFKPGTNAITNMAAGGSTYSNTVKIVFPNAGLRYPVYFKTWVACGAVSSPIMQYVESKCANGPIPFIQMNAT